MIRRVVTGHKAGKAVFIADGVPPRTDVHQKFPGMEFSLAWATSLNPHIPVDGEAESVSRETPIIPKLGETRLMFMRLPPDSVALSEDFDPAAAGAEMAALQPDIAATFEPEDPRFHRTDSIDYIIVLDGEVFLELDDQEEVGLKEHDVVIQAGTRHAWRNKSTRPVTLAFMLVGAQRDGS